MISLDEEKTRKELEKFLSKELTKDFNEVIKKLQEAKSDACRLWQTGPRIPSRLMGTKGNGTTRFPTCQ